MREVDGGRIRRHAPILPPHPWPSKTLRHRPDVVPPRPARDDNAALYHALRSCRQVHCVFVFDTAILDSLPREDRRVEFIRESLVVLDEDLRRAVPTRRAG
jgi:hypothetical protein